MTKSKLLTMFGSILAAVAIVAGCATTGNNSNATALEQFAITSGVAIGTSYAVTPPNGNPAYRPEFVLAETVLNGVASGSNSLTSAQVQAVLAQNGVTNSVIAPIIVNGLQLADQYAANGTNATVQNVAGWISQGIQEGLGSTPAALKAKYHKN